MNANRRRRSERGQSLTEFAVSFVALVFILAVAVDLGRMYFAFVELREAAEEGAIYGSINAASTDEIRQRVRTNSSTPVDLTDTTNVDVGVATPGGTCAGNSMIVTVTYQFQLTMPLVGTIIGTQTFPISASATTTILLPVC